MEIPKTLSLTWLSGDQVLNFSKFLGVLEEDGSGTIYVGRFQYHGLLGEAAQFGNKRLFAAGAVFRDGHVADWRSTDYHFATSEELKEPLKKFMADHAEQLNENWEK